MPAYVIANIDVTDPEGYREYAEQVGATIAAHGGRYLARRSPRGPRGRVAAAAAGDSRVPEPRRRAAWYESEEYGPVKQIRLATSTGQVVITEGVVP